VIDYTFHPEAEAELDAAALVYDAQSGGVGTAFVAAVERAILFLRTYPEAGSPVSPFIRRVRVRGFPYTLIYRIQTDGAFVLAVAHVRRRDDYWRSRE